MRLPLLVLLVASACRDKAKVGSQELAPETKCERFFHHVESITRVPHPDPYNAAELALCKEHTDEQLQCSLAATDTVGLGLCEGFADPQRRALGKRVGDDIRRTWGRDDEMAVLTTTPGCAFFGVMGNERFALGDTAATIAFAIREPGATGDAQTVITSMVRDAAGWRCVDTDPPQQCERLVAKCKR
jgi:hypothetical protein